MKIAVVQIRAGNRSAAENRERILFWTEKAAAGGCEAVFFPELSDTGYRLDRIRECAGVSQGKSFETSRSAARDNGIHLFCGLAEKTRSGIYNTLAVFDAEGRLAVRYRKIHLFPAGAIPENRVFLPGRKPCVVRVSNFGFGLLLCYDMRFPALSSALVDRGAEALVVAAAWPASRFRHWRILLRARAVENQCYVIGVNHTGSYRGSRFCGRSLVVDPLGHIVFEMGARDEQLGMAELDRALVKSVRANIPAVRERGKTLFLPPRRICHVRGKREGRE